MAIDFSGTNTERTDKVVVTLVEVRTTVRLLLAAVGVVGPIIVGILSFLLTQSSATNAKLERLTERSEANAAKLERLAERTEANAAKREQLAERTKSNDAKLEQLAQRTEANAAILARISAQLDRLEKAVKP